MSTYKFMKCTSTYLYVYVNINTIVRMVNEELVEHRGGTSFGLYLVTVEGTSTRSFDVNNTTTVLNQGLQD